MTFQHRSRIKTSVDYSFIASDMGACCLPNKKDPTESQYQFCLEQNGYFIPTEIDGDGKPILDGLSCPYIHDSMRGCCCSCSYVDDFDAFFNAPGSFPPSSGNYSGINISNCDDNDLFACYNGGIRDNITKCECDRLNGVWSPNSCEYHSGVGLEVATLCTNFDTIYDVRWPGSCCTSETCHNLCSAKECSEIEEPTEDILWRPNSTCEETDCLDGFYRSAAIRDIRTGLLISYKDPKRTTVRTEEKTENMGSCCVYIDQNNNVVSSILNKDECISLNGVWSGVDPDGDFNPTNSTRCEEILDLYSNDGQINSSYVNKWLIGERVFDGRYIGTFNVHSSSFGTGSVCFGRPETGVARDYIAMDYTENENNKKKYAVIVADKDLFVNKTQLDKSDVNITQETILNSSSWDTNINSEWINIAQDVLNSKNTKYIKWTLPSLGILSFAYRQMNTKEFIKNIDKDKHHSYQHMKNKYYWTSTLYEKKINSKVHAYIQSFDLESKVGIKPITNTSYTRPFLLIPIK